ncbi:MAG: glutamine synthetase family protein [Pseudomonadota bacterium]
MSENNLSPEDSAILASLPNLESIDLLIADNNGLLRGKRIARSALDKVYKQGICLPFSVFGCNITGETSEQTGLGFTTGDRDTICVPIPGSLQPIPWKGSTHVQLMMTMLDDDGELFPGNARVVLQSMLARLKQQGLTPVIAVELEFFLFDKAFDDNGEPCAPTHPLKNERDRDEQVYLMETLDAYEAFIQDVKHYAQLQNVPADTATAECGPGQFEINLLHTDDAVAACDQALMLKRIIKAVAAKHGYLASFMAKPQAESVGSGTHVHISLLDAAGNNVFASPIGEPNETLLHALGGLQASMADAMLLFAPHANSWRRFQLDSYVSLNPCWGYNNRTVALRIPTSDENNRRIEHRIAGADANPYLVTAAILAGIHYGLTQKLKPTAPITGNAYDQTEPTNPRQWQHALQLFDESNWIQAYFDSTFIKVFSAIKHDEIRLFEQKITPLEYHWYLNNV